VPSVSKNQQALFCIALSIKKGETPASYSAQAAKMAKEMSEEQLSDYCKSPIEE